MAIHRLDDARGLLLGGRYNGAIYLAGYAIECYLKYTYCVRKEATYLPAALETHHWDVLVLAAGLEADLRAEPETYNLYSGLAEEWGPALRYRIKAYQKAEAHRLYNELQMLYQALREFTP